MTLAIHVPDLCARLKPASTKYFILLMPVREETCSTQRAMPVLAPYLIEFATKKFYSHASCHSKQVNCSTLQSCCATGPHTSMRAILSAILSAVPNTTETQQNSNVNLSATVAGVYWAKLHYTTSPTNHSKVFCAVQPFSGISSLSQSLLFFQQFLSMCSVLMAFQQHHMPHLLSSLLPVLLVGLVLLLLVLLLLRAFRGL